MKPYPRSRVTGEKVREVIARVILQQVKDPRCELVTVTGVEMSPDLRYAKVFVVAHGGLEEQAEALAGLESAKGRIRTAVGAAVRMRLVPELSFVIDPTLATSARISEIIRDEHAAGRVPVDEEPSDPDAPASDG